MDRLDGKVVVLSGASRGIGKGLALGLAEAGAAVVCAARSSRAHPGELPGTVEDIAEEIGARGGRAVPVRADIGVDDDVQRMVNAAVDEYGRLDCAANCAGVGGGHGSTHDYHVETWNRIVDVNLRGTWLAMRHEIKAMLAGSEGGTVVNVASTLSLRGSPFGSPYSASKHGVLGLTRTAAIEYASHGIRVNAVCPGAIDTPMMDETFARFEGLREALISFVPMGRMGRPEEVAHAIAWLASEGSSFVTGEALCVEGGLLAR